MASWEAVYTLAEAQQRNSWALERNGDTSTRRSVGDVDGSLLRSVEESEAAARRLC